tara:strand:+ start:426 stop:1571 length:1146 start_codon:yes stop_codon:yes gene_type:complete
VSLGKFHSYTAGTKLSLLKEELRRLSDLFELDGALTVEMPSLVDSEVLLDLYGEELNSRAYIVEDPVRGNLMLRPDFTVPIVQMHLESGIEAEKYCYAGKVWRKQDQFSLRQTEYWQAGFEHFGGKNVPADDVAAFSLIRKAIGNLDLEIVTGDLGILRSAINGLTTNTRCKKALLRQLWRPARFRQTLQYFSSSSSLIKDNQLKLIEALKVGSLEKELSQVGPIIGLRRAQDIVNRIEFIAEDSKENQINEFDLKFLEDLLSISCPLVEASAYIKKISRSNVELNEAVILLENRLDAMSDAKVDTKKMSFEVSFGRTSMEYYDGFVFEIHVDKKGILAPVAQGGRYDELTKFFNNRGDSENVLSAIGGIIRPEILIELMG